MTRLPQLRDLYPAATLDAALQTRRPTPVPFNARMLDAAAVLVGTIPLVLTMFLSYIGNFVNPQAINRLAGGSGIVTYDDGKPLTLQHTLLADLVIPCMMLGVAAFVFGRIALRSSSRGERRISWSQWARERGAVPVPRLPEQAAGRFAQLSRGSKRTWHGPYSCQLGGHEAYVGATAWNEGSNEPRKRMFFVLVRLSDDVERQFSISSLTHWMRGTDPGLALNLFESRELRLESTHLDVGSQIRVGRDSDDVRWRQLFDAPLVAALGDTIDVQWCQKGRWMLCGAKGLRLSQVPVEALDTQAVGMEFVARWIDHVAYRREHGDLADGVPSRRVA